MPPSALDTDKTNLPEDIKFYSIDQLHFLVAQNRIADFNSHLYSGVTPGEFS